MRRLTIFAKGNVDVHDSLQYMRINAIVEWNGVNAVLQDRHPDWVARVKHEGCARWDRSGIPPETVPPELEAKKPELGTMTLQAQFSSGVFDQPVDVVVLSMQSDVTNVLQTRSDGSYAFLDIGLGDDAYRQWLRDAFTLSRRRSPQESMRNLETILDAIHARSKAHVLVYNMSPWAPGEQISSYRGLADVESLRIRQYNVALCELAQKRHDFTIVDVDQVLARAGADRLKLDFMHHLRDGHRLITNEVVRLLEVRGVFD